MSKIIKVEDAPKVPYTLGGKAYRVMLVTEETTGAREVNMIMLVTPPNQPSRIPHYHRKRESLFFVLQGKGKAIIEGKEYDIEPNMAIYIPPCEKHAFRNMGNTELKMLECFTYPPILADWVDALE